MKNSPGRKERRKIQREAHRKGLGHHSQYAYKKWGK